MMLGLLSLKTYTTKAAFNWHKNIKKIKVTSESVDKILCIVVINSFGLVQF
jgi:hypothetical protein